MDLQGHWSIEKVKALWRNVIKPIVASGHLFGYTTSSQRPNAVRSIEVL